MGLNQNILSAYNGVRNESARAKLCHVPDNHLFFSFEGVVKNCCFGGKSFRLGKYPEQSIKEIWRGEAFQTFRNSVANNELENGCQLCLTHLNAESFDTVPAKRYDYYADFEGDPDYPKVMEFELSNLCNLECVMCNGDYSSLIRAKKEGRPPITEVYDDAFVEQLEEFIPHLKEASFFGGEPFLIKIYFKIWEVVSRIKPDLEMLVQTNGTVLNNQVKRVLENGRFRINVSIDGLDKETFESIRKNGNFDRAIQNIRYFQKYCSDLGTAFYFSPSPIRKNMHQVPQFLQFCNDEGILLMLNTVVHPYLHTIGLLPSDQLSAYHDELLAAPMPESNQIEKLNKANYLSFVSQVAYWKDEAKKREEKRKKTT